LTHCRRGRRLSAVPDLFTVEFLARYIAWKTGPGATASVNGTATVPTNGHPSPVQRQPA
jgi:hypothetical protein